MRFVSDFETAKEIAEYHFTNIVIGIGNSFCSKFGIEETELKNANLILAIQDALQNAREEEKNNARNRIRKKFSSLAIDGYDFKDEIVSSI